MRAFQVVILGGGPAGCATAIALRGHGVEVFVVEAGSYGGTRVGETLPPDTRRLLERLQVWDEFVADGHDPCLGSCSSWGDDALGYNDFLFNPLGPGWHLDRSRFDKLLVHAAARRGVEVRTGTRFVARSADGEGFLLQLHAPLSARADAVRTGFVVDATGRRGAFAHAMAAQPVLLDELVYLAGFFEIAGASRFPRLTMLEAVQYGWWYAARLPGDRVTVAVATDRALMKEMRLYDADQWLACLDATNHVAAALSGCTRVRQPLLVRSAPSLLRRPVAGSNWLAVGDAASTYDPLSSQGIHKALLDGLEAADAIVKWFDGGGFGGYEAAVARRFEQYAAIRSHFYQLEERWSDGPFWQRRRDLESPAAIGLAPT